MSERSRAHPWFRLPPSHVPAAEQLQLHLELRGSDAHIFRTAYGYICNTTHCGCRTRPLKQRMPGIIHGFIKSPLGR